MQSFSLTDIGSVREENQDRVCVLQHSELSHFAILCDGMGGENAGSLASETAISTIRDIITENYSDELDADSIRRLLTEAVQEANSRVFEISQSDDDKAGMGTTCVLALRRKNLLYCVNVGDSRCYIINGDEICQLTRDHTVVRDLFEKGEITFEEMKTHPRKNLITRAVGVDEFVMLDYYEDELNGNDTILLCSDGLYGGLEEYEMAQTVAETEREEACRTLIDKAIANGSRDNVSVALIYGI